MFYKNSSVNNFNMYSSPCFVFFTVDNHSDDDANWDVADAKSSSESEKGSH